jgi:4-hydroxy-tetrahydrodipicolinate reductase
MLRVAVAGAHGRMGRLAREAICEAPDMVYAGGFTRIRNPEDDAFDDVHELIAQRLPEVIVDFTTRPATQNVARAAVEARIPVIIGSSEWNAEEREELAALCEQKDSGALLVPNFAIGAVLMMRFAEEAARFFPTVEIVELHREDKRDKPSGTAAATAERIRTQGGPQDVPIHSVRLRGLVSHQEVLLGNTGELLTIRHDSLSVASFAAGILYAIRNVSNVRGLRIGLDALLRQAQDDMR